MVWRALPTDLVSRFNPQCLCLTLEIEPLALVWLWGNFQTMTTNEHCFSVSKVYLYLCLCFSPLQSHLFPPRQSDFASAISEGNGLPRWRQNTSARARQETNHSRGQDAQKKDKNSLERSETTGVPSIIEQLQSDNAHTSARCLRFGNCDGVTVTGNLYLISTLAAVPGKISVHPASCIKRFSPHIHRTKQISRTSRSTK